MTEKICCLWFLLFCVSLGRSQEIKGIIVEESGTAIPGVSILNLKTGSGTTSESQGEFQIENIEFPAQLEFSILGYQNLVRTFRKPNDSITITLVREVDMLSEVLLRSSNISQQVRQTPAAVGIISSEDLKRKDNFNLVQNFNYVPGVYVNQGALNTNKINIRGIGSRSQYSTNRIKAYFNGIPITTAEGELTIDDFDPETIDRIEIFKGPVSSVFGAGLGGAINLYTPEFRTERRSVEGGFSYGSFNTRKYTAGISYVKDSLDLNFRYSKLESDGYRENGNYDRLGMTTQAGFLNKKGNRWNLFYSHINLKAYIPSSLNEDDFLNEPEKAAFSWNQAAGYESYSRNILGLSYDQDLSENWQNLSSIFYNSRDGYEPRPFDILDEERQSVGLRSRFNHQLKLLSIPSEISFGTELIWEFYDVWNYENLYEEIEERRSLQGDLINSNSQNRNYLNFFAQLNLDPTEKLHIEAGLNFNSTSYDLEDNFMEDDIDQSGDYSFDPVLSPRLGISYTAFPEKTFYASVSHGFSTPSVAETLTPEGLINTDLKTETGLNYEVGFKGSWLERRLYTELSLYSIQIRNLLVARRVGQDQYVGVNAGKADHNGIEFTSTYTSYFTGGWQLDLFLNSNFNFFTFDRFVDLGENYSGNELPGVPDYMITPGLELGFRNANLNLNYQAFGEMPLNDANSRYTDAYQLLNLRLGYEKEVLSGLALNLNFGINNILDENYAASVVTNAVGFGGSDPRYYYPGEPRNYYGGVSLRYDF
ncbi:TonB-dependent receptor [Gramella sp. GC03-9]|uniref:TonB-dependent receptor n=1 Tax=Christiangramia oceanisediminis TaxID=2920386 RepID=A0A9X2KZT7_9FLAO|nr:TonB-dependent receptor [Gramella oceanisediminis]MCP9201388.1 TonB-dependent receptor [Gramella oceanisediminis]